jgi:putative phage-type endonuclease
VLLGGETVSLTAEQSRIRRSGVTGTDLPALLGLSPFATPFDVWLEKMGRAEPKEQTEDMERGVFLEAGARDWYRHRTGALRVDEPGTVVSRRNPLIIATPDGLALQRDGWRVLEIKMPGNDVGWGEPGTDAVPDYYVPQALWQLAATEHGTCDVFAVLKGKPRLYHVTRDLEIEGLLIETAERFWRDHVVTGKPPEVTAADLPSVSRWLKRHETSEHLDFNALPPEAQVTLEEYARAYHQYAEAKEAKALWEVRTKLLVAGAPGVRGLPEATGFSRIDWEAHDEGKASWKKVAQELAARGGVGEKELAALAAKHTGDAARPFTPRPLKRGR